MRRLLKDTWFFLKDKKKDDKKSKLKLKAATKDYVNTSHIMDYSLDSNGEKMEPDATESLKKVTSYTLITVLLCSYQLLLCNICLNFLLGLSSIS